MPRSASCPLSLVHIELQADKVRMQLPVKHARLQPTVCQAASRPPRHKPSLHLDSTVLTSRIKQSADWRAVLELVASYSQSLDAIRAASALHRLSHVRPQDLHSVLQHRGWALLLRSLETNAARLNPRSLSNVLLALGRLRQAPQPLLDQLLLAAQAGLPSFNAQDLSNALWGLAALRKRPGQPFMLAAEARTADVVPDATPQAVANILWAYATLEYRPSDQLLSLLAERLLAALPLAEPQNVANSLWACHQLEYQPALAWMVQVTAFVSNCLQVTGWLHTLCCTLCTRSLTLPILQAFGIAEIRQTLLGLTGLSHDPGPDVMAAMAQRLQQMPAPSPQRSGGRARRAEQFTLACPT